MTDNELASQILKMVSKLNAEQQKDVLKWIGANCPEAVEKAKMQKKTPLCRKCCRKRPFYQKQHPRFNNILTAKQINSKRKSLKLKHFKPFYLANNPNNHTMGFGVHPLSVQGVNFCH